MQKEVNMLSVNGLLLQVNKGNVGKIVSRIQMAVTTAVEEVDLSKTCRVCLVKQTPQNLFCLFGLNKMFQDLSIASAILDCFGVELKENEDLPKYVCIKCASNTLQSYTFKKCLTKCQDYLDKQKKLAVVKKDVITNLENKENNIDYLSQDKPSNEEMKNSNSNNIDTTMCSLDHSYNFLYDRKTLISYILADHNYNKEQTINNYELEKTKNDTKPKISATKTTNMIKRKNVLGAKNSNGSLNKFESDRWWCKEAGPPYVCKICGRVYGVRFRAFYMHARMHHVKKLPCTYCGKIFSRDKMKIHLRSHTKEKPFVCDQCPARFSVLGNLTRHLRCHTGEKLFICDICGKAFTQSTSLQNHKQAHAGQTLFVCVYCGKTFSSDSSHRSHLYLHHNSIKSVDSSNGNSKEKHICSTCGKVFSKAVALRIHVRIHTDNKRYRCDLCHKKFNSHLNYKIHSSWHDLLAMDNCTSENKDWHCEFCTEIFNEKDTLVAHVLTHMSRPFVCSVCGKNYVNKTTFLRHSRQHTSGKPFSCSICCKTFRYSASLTQHVRIHTGEKPYKCEVCERLFAQHQQLISHMFTHTGEKKYICPYCGKAFALNGNLTVHKRRHTGETPYVCVDCGKGFYDSSTLKKHKVLHMNELKNISVNEIKKIF